ncbi:hypothetical protein ASG39_17035 [Rhizobium sp. Leaf371]|uniref:4'-phosphopantetheinyl transferase family protein n=1 Tax=Rhizobium sp. Leaf371 TaxID=1736355 RepID=UPI0007127662|nr:4'-phosphopantetheinyl transferase superfamily protein [Rhizobium sp. Leaf371]KQS61262.1 hypothetical protein ASG39_17035 [Rhizobium sp. Leaf371]
MSEPFFRSLFDPRIATSEGLIGEYSFGDFPEEAALMRNAAPKRRAEFFAGRACARHALGQLGLRPVAIPSDADRAPVWPDGIVGSLSHSQTLAGVALASKADGFRSIGLDIEEATPLDESYAEEICIASERDWLARMPAERRGLLLKVIFSAKECAYKCQYPLTRTFLGFEAFRIDLDCDNGSFVAETTAAVGPFPDGYRLAGRFLIARDHIATAITLR